jgi:hypothetical protein
MSKGVVLFAFNNERDNYYEMAEYCAKRVNHFLNLPVTLITDEKSIPSDTEYTFDNVIKVDAQDDNAKNKDSAWINKGRYQAYELTPYDETIVLDTDYIVNSDQLNHVFDLYDDFMCAKTATYLMFNDAPKDIISERSFDVPWATIMVFKKTQKAKQIFESIKMVQDNYLHYANLYNFIPAPYRNDFALAIALHIVYGGLVDEQVYIPWNLLHVNERVTVYKANDEEMDTVFVTTKFNKRTEYIKIKDTDFHMLNKKNFTEIING